MAVLNNCWNENTNTSFKFASVTLYLNILFKTPPNALCVSDINLMYQLPRGRSVHL